MPLRKIAAFLAAFGLTAGLVGAGVSAQFSDAATAVQNAAVGTFGCTISSSVANAVVSVDKHSVTVTAPDIMGSGQSSFAFPFTVTSTGSVPLQVHLTVALTNPGNTFSDMLNPSLPNGTQDVIVGPAPASHTFAGGLKWGSLDDTYLGKTVSIKYTADCGEIVHGTNNNVFICTYVGTPGVNQSLAGIALDYTNGAPGTYFQYPAGNTVGSLAYVLAYNDGQPQPPLSACPAPSNSSTNATVHFWKTVDNTFGGTALPSDFMLVLSQNSAPVVTGHDGDVVRVAPGAYSLTEDPVGNTQQGGCYQDLATMPAPGQGMITDVTMASGETWYCGFVNQGASPATVVFSNTYVDSAGASIPGPVTPVTMHMTGTNSYTGTDGNLVDMAPGTYTVSQDLPAGWMAGTGTCSDLIGSGGTVGPTITVTNGDLWQCGFTNTFVGP